MKSRLLLFLFAILIANLSYAADIDPKFEIKNVGEALKALKASKAAVDKNVKLKIAEIAENGAVVPVEVDARAIKDVKSIAILVDKNPSPLIAVFDVSNTAPFISTRIRMAGTSDVRTIVTSSDGKVVQNHKEVKVTIGGCGG